MSGQRARESMFIVNFLPLLVRFAREHNRLAEQLARQNAHWNDEQLYQTARKIVIAEIQHITFSEYLPLVLGKDGLNKHEIQLLDQGFYHGGI